MRFASVAILFLGLSVSAMAQQTSSYKVKRSGPQKAPKSSALAPVGKSSGSGTATSSNARDLQTIEHQTAKTSKPAHPVKTNTPKAAIKPVQDKPNPPMNFNGTGGKNAGLTSQSSNPYKGRLKQKSTGSQH